MDQILEKIRLAIEDVTNAKYEADEYGVHLDEKSLDKIYREKVVDVLHRKENQSILKELWRSDETSRSLHDIQYFPHPANVGGMFVIETFLLKSEDLLSQRYRGIYNLIMNEGFLSKERLISTADIKKIIEDKDLALKYPLTHLFLKKVSEIAIRIGNKHSLRINIVAGETRDIIKYHDERGFYLTVPYHVVSDEEDRIQAIVERALAIIEFWREWVKVREEIARDLGLDDKAFVMRDLMEGVLRLPIWTVMVQPIDGSWGLLVDLKYAEHHQKLSNGEWFDTCRGFIKAELKRTDQKSLFRIYSAPVYFGLFLQEAMEKIHAGHSLKEVFDMLNMRKVNPITYLFNRFHLGEIAKNHPALAAILTSLVDLVERESTDSLKIIPIQVECIWEPPVTFLVKPIQVDEYSSISTEPDLVDVSLMIETEYSDGEEFPFKVIEATEKLRKARRKFINILKEY